MQSITGAATASRLSAINLASQNEFPGDLWSRLSRGVQICHRPKSYDRFTIDFTTDFFPIIDENSVVNLWLSIFESVVRTIDFFPMIDKKSVVNLWLIYGESMVEVQPYYYQFYISNLISVA